MGRETALKVDMLIGDVEDAALFGNDLASCIHSDKSLMMSNRRARVPSARIGEGEVNNLIFKLQEVLPDSISRGYSKATARKIMKEACSYIKKLHKEVDDLSENLSGLVPSGDVNDTERAPSLSSHSQANTT